MFGILIGYAIVSAIMDDWYFALGTIIGAAIMAAFAHWHATREHREWCKLADCCN